MARVFKYKYPEHIGAGHFNVYPKPWMNGKLIWFWTKGDSENAIGLGGFSTREEAEDAAKAWYDEGAAKLLKAVTGA